IGFGDTTGMCNPAYASDFFAAALPPVLRTGRRGESLRSPPGSRYAARSRSIPVAVDQVASLLLVFEIRVSPALFIGAFDPPPHPNEAEEEA
ncbi:hypothetical protein, partial [Rhodococcus koreensis]